MKLTFPILICGAIFLVAISQSATAQIPRVFNYQGVLSDPSGNVLGDGTHLLIVKLYDTADAATPIYIEAQSVQLSKGVFNMYVGAVTPIPASMKFDRTYYLGVSIDGADEMVPRTVMSANAYALHSLVADALSPGAQGAVTTLNGGSGALHLNGVNGAVVTRNGDTISIGGFGTGGALPLPYIGNDPGSLPSFTITNSGAGKVGVFIISDSTNNSSAIEARTAGGGPAIFAARTINNGLVPAILATTNSVARGIDIANAASGIVGEVNADSPNDFSAGVRGINRSLTEKGIGVAAYHAGSGWGLWAETPSGAGVMGLGSATSGANVGVRGETRSPSGTGVLAMYGGTGNSTALEIRNGAVKVSGNYRPAFVHYVTPTNTNGGVSVIDNPATNGDSTAIILITRATSSGPRTTLNDPVALWYDSGAAKWTIYNDAAGSLPTGTKFNVWVVKQ